MINYADIYENAPNIFLLIDSEMNIISANKAAVRTYGYTKEELLKMRVDELESLETVEQFNLQFPVAQSNGMIYESIHKTKDNRAISVELCSKKIELGGNPIVVCIIRDITERKKLTENCMFQKSYFDNLFDKSPEGIVVLDNNYLIVKVNKGFENLFSYTLDEVVGMSLTTLVIPEDLIDEVKSQLNNINVGEIWDKETVRKRKDGSMVDVYVRVHSIVEKDKQIGLYVMYADMSEMKKAYSIIQKRYEIENVFSNISKLFLSLEKFSDLLNKVLKDIGNFISVDRVGVFIFNDNNSYIDNNNNWFSGEIKSGRNDSSVINSEEYPDWIQNVIKGQIVTINADEINKKANKRLSGIVNLKSSLIIPMHTAYGVIGFIEIDSLTKDNQWSEKDISFLNTCCEIIMLSYERNKAEIHLRKSNSELNETIEKLKSTQLQLFHNEKMASIGYLASGVAHEINNPLGFVSSNFETLKSYWAILEDTIVKYRKLESKIAETNEDSLEVIKDLKKEELNFIFEDLKDLFEDTNEGLNRISTIVKGLRNFSHKANEDTFEEYDLNSGIRNTLIISKNEIKYFAEIEEKLQDIPLIEAIPGHINQVILNMIINSVYAIKAKESKGLGLIKITTSSDEKYVYCIIEDNGSGISNENLQKLFTPFFTTKPVGQGTGLGLSISYDIIKNKHKGDILVSSEYGKGTIFTIKLPIKQPEPE